MYLGQLFFWGSPFLLIGGPLGVVAAIFTFRRMLRAYREFDQQSPQKK
jgi:hypothetical protein